ncbi:diaminobutyrate acetyltransferase [Alkalilimnicola sp. S0819]|uniref:diaminobutyrate acetyltransferase n=1 Tax=Alkalilimnicola sp. S0819 TaxID=2613922 RepID=UPI001261C3DA|nr:diaminobutyrate acetyltransferase [Alkalilimnicola sp. S0819]KAB7627227.1 diaminobutyrate acetyltransferase [Alkalilimnicola sp. S0819]MPQ15940.1 diaminobutyrate acetyltransferase [Alkalilimnicola sp. S0819]
MSDDGITFRNPTVEDGGAIWRIVKESGVLDLNSSYMYLLLCKDFGDSCVIAEHEGRAVGFVTGYRPPGRPEAAFLWQVGVDSAMRGHGLGKRLLGAFLRSPGNRGATRLETTISPDNDASRALFRAVARDLGAEVKVEPCFTAAHFPEAGHEDEELFLIGPFDAETPNKLPY